MTNNEALEIQWSTDKGMKQDVGVTMREILFEKTKFKKTSEHSYENVMTDKKGQAGAPSGSSLNGWVDSGTVNWNEKHGAGGVS